MAATPSVRLVELAVITNTNPASLQQAVGGLDAEGVEHANIGFVIEIQRPEHVEELHALLAATNGRPGQVSKWALCARTTVGRRRPKADPEFHPPHRHKNRSGPSCT